MKNHRFLWLRNRTTNNRKCEKARNIKEKRTIEMFNTVSKQLVALRSSPSAEIYCCVSKMPPNRAAFFVLFQGPIASRGKRGYTNPIPYQRREVTL